MKSYIERTQGRATAPHDIVAVNKLLMAGIISPDIAEERLEALDDSWWGIVGPFQELSRRLRMQVAVDKDVIARVTEPQPGFAENKLVVIDSFPPQVQGWLGMLAVVEIDKNLPKGAANWMGTHAVAAELHHSPDFGELSYAAVSIPFNNGTGIHYPTIFRVAAEPRAELV